MDNSNNSNSFSGGLSIVVFIVFLVLKLCKVIDWSWWWVTSPIWISISILMFIVVGVTSAIAFLKTFRK
ncbi:hypothetical protein [Chryseobacterium arthrosphaerae]|uniref:hypothetical protein n=1 Tax=Chryseobacterium arthrosphaerae TaxID=651561 RepID=UPI003B0082CD